MKYTIYTKELKPITDVDMKDEVDNARLHDAISIGLWRVIKSIEHGYFQFGYVTAQKELLQDGNIGLIVNKDDEQLLKQVI